mmetsp:Transcript_61649/g.97748  ORF Transcript_61649/g.97748 Transcript_61649/m.97748 type:complete len:88 (-) Transcript_61649:12-275(-)
MRKVIPTPDRPHLVGRPASDAFLSVYSCDEVVQVHVRLLEGDSEGKTSGRRKRCSISNTACKRRALKSLSRRRNEQAYRLRCGKGDL